MTSCGNVGSGRRYRQVTYWCGYPVTHYHNDENITAGKTGCATVRRLLVREVITKHNHFLNGLRRGRYLWRFRKYARVWEYITVTTSYGWTGRHGLPGNTAGTWKSSHLSHPVPAVTLLPMTVRVKNGLSFWIGSSSTLMKNPIISGRQGIKTLISVTVVLPS